VVVTIVNHAVTVSGRGVMLLWVDRLVAITGWQQEPEEIDWGPGSFSAYLEVHGGPASDGLLETWRVYQAMSARPPGVARMLAPYGLYGGPGTAGLILWGSDQQEGEYYWLADSSVNPAEWPVIARTDATAEWYRFDMGVSEFTYRLVADPEFEPFTVAHTTGKPFYLPAGQTISSLEEWQAIAGLPPES
jgi:hypothetical protein